MLNNLNIQESVVINAIKQAGESKLTATDIFNIL